MGTGTVSPHAADVLAGFVWFVLFLAWLMVPTHKGTRLGGPVGFLCMLGAVAGPMLMFFSGGTR